jgi:hypothetical protein
MNFVDIIVYLLLAGLIGYAATFWYVSARRRRARSRAVKLALIRRRSDHAWQRLNRSSAGAP